MTRLPLKKCEKIVIIISVGKEMDGKKKENPMKRIRILAVILLMMMIFSGCGSREASSPDPGNKTETGSSAVNEDEADNEEATEPSEGSGRETDARDVEIYYIDDATGEMVTETAEIKDEDDIWSQLQKKGVLTEECRMLSFDLNEEERTIDLDFNSALGDRVRSFGTTGETEIIGCLINTYLDAYECEGIRLTEEGQVFETGHGAEFDGYTGKIEL